MTYRSRIDLGVAAAVIAIGVIFAVEAWRIDPRSYESVGPRLVPEFLAILMILLGAAVGVGAWINRARETDIDKEFGFRNSDLRRVFLVIGTGGAYAFAFWAFGYLVATILGAALALWVFGLRSPVLLIVVPIVAGALYQFVFMGMMGLLDPRGEVLDLRFLSALITPGR